MAAPGALRALAWPVLACLAGCGFETVGGRALGTTYAIRAECPQALPRQAVERELRRIDARMSTYAADSELMAFNRAPVGVWVPVSAELAEVAAAAAAIAEQTGGAFDPTVAPLSARWGFGAGGSAAAVVGYRHLGYRMAPPALVRHDDIAVDLSAIAKGHAVDRISGRLAAAGCANHLVELGGEVRAAGRAPGGGSWRIGIESPDGAGYLDGPILLGDGAVATSGDYRQYRLRADGTRSAHVIDPRSGHPIGSRTASATVVARTARAADAYATALLVLGAREGLRFAERRGIAALFVVRAGAAGDAAQFDIVQSAAMERYRTALP